MPNMRANFFELPEYPWSGWKTIDDDKEREREKKNSPKTISDPNLFAKKKFWPQKNVG